MKHIKPKWINKIVKSQKRYLKIEKLAKVPIPKSVKLQKLGLKLSQLKVFHSQPKFFLSQPKFSTYSQSFSLTQPKFSPYNQSFSLTIESLVSLVNCSVIITIIWEPNFHFASDHQWSQWLLTIATITITGIESESISAIVVIVNDHQRSQKVNGNHQCSDCSNHNNCNDPSDHMEIIAQRLQRSWRSQRSYVFSDLNNPSDYGNQTSAVLTIAVVKCFQQLQWSQQS